MAPQLRTCRKSLTSQTPHAERTKDINVGSRGTCIPPLLLPLSLCWWLLRGFGRPSLGTQIDPRPWVPHRHGVRRHRPHRNPSRLEHGGSTTSGGKTGLTAGLSTRSTDGSVPTV